PQAAKLASYVAPKVSRAMNIQNRGVKAGNLHEVREPNQHAILIEGGFMDSRIDITAMRRNDMLAAQGRAVAEGVVQYYGLKKGSGGTVCTPPPAKPSKPTTKPSSGNISGSTYTVKKGDNLSTIAQPHGMTTRQLQKLNGIKNANLIYPGQTLKVSWKAPGKSIDQMAREVIRGQHGKGHANRQKSLGVNNATYQKVRNRVNQLL